MVKTISIHLSKPLLLSIEDGTLTTQFLRDFVLESSVALEDYLFEVKRTRSVQGGYVYEFNVYELDRVSRNVKMVGISSLEEQAYLIGLID